MKKITSLFFVACVSISSPSYAKTLSQCSSEAGESSGEERKAIVKACLLGGSKEVDTKDVRTPLQKYEGSVSYAMIGCQIAFAGSQAGGGQDVGKCIDDAKKDVKKAYDSALKMVKKLAARSAMKEHYISSISSIQGIQPQFEERKINYEKRQGDNKTKLDEMWVRFETENE